MMNMRQRNSRSREPVRFILAAPSKLDPDERIGGYEEKEKKAVQLYFKGEKHKRNMGRA